MARFKITGPDGQSYAITAPDDATDEQISSVIGSHINSAQPKPQVSAGEMAADVGKSAGIGLVQGGIGLATLPGNVESLARTGVNAGAGMVGVKPPFSDETLLPTYGDWKKRVEGYTGEFYEPKTTAGEYARTIGEFAPLALGGGGVAAAATRVLGPAITSETAGQFTKGTAAEPWARAGGALVGGRVPNTAARMRTPNIADPVRARQVAQLEAEGVNALSAGQRTGNIRLRGVEDATARFPGGGRMTALQDQASGQYTSAALRRGGIQADRATPDVLENAFNAIGQEYQQFAQGRIITSSTPYRNRLQNISAHYDNVSSDATRVPAIRAAAEDLARRPNLSGQEYGALRQQFGVLQRGFQRSQNIEASTAMRRVIEAMDTQAVRSAPRAQRPQVAAELADRNRRFRNLTILEDASGRTSGEGAAVGYISPASLKAAVKKANRQDYTRGRGELAPLARAGEGVLTRLPSSGTAERNLAQQIVMAPSTAYSGMAGALVGAGDPASAMIGAAVAPALKVATARAITNPRVQRYLGNQKIPRQIPDDVDPRIARIIAAMLASQDQSQQR